MAPVKEDQQILPVLCLFLIVVIDFEEIQWQGANFQKVLKKTHIKLKLELSLLKSTWNI